VVIITYENKDLLERCVHSIEQALKSIHNESVITVVDNASRDGTDELVRNQFSHVNYIRNRENVGLSRALNIGIESRYDSEYTLLLNDDIELFSDTIAVMLETLTGNPSAKGIPARLMRPDGSFQKMKLRIMGVDRSEKNKVKFITFAGTTACMYYTEILKEVGLFDEFYFFYNEDLDFSLRAKRRGVRFIFNPDVKVVHYKSQGRNKGEKKIRPYFYATDYYFYRKNYNALFASVYLAMALAHIALMRRRLKKNNDQVKLTLLEEGNKKLRYTMKNFKKLVKRSHVR
jgi:GT2 family glycosyltransferase